MKKIILLTMLFTLSIINVYADIASGTCGTCYWKIDNDSCLTIGPSNGVSGKLELEFTETEYMGDVVKSPWHENISYVKHIVISDGVSVEGSIHEWFYNYENLVSANLKGLNTDKVTDMSYMFNGCSSLTALDVSNFNTENVTNMRYMFYGCSSLTALDVSNFNTSNVTDMNSMFWKCSGLSTLDVSNFNTDNVTDMGAMFSLCSSLTALDVSNFNTDNVTDMGAMFGLCSSLTSLNLSNFNTSNVTYMWGMFYGCSSLTTLDLSNFNTKKVKSVSEMFHECSNLTALDVSKFNTSNVTDMYYMFRGCSSLTSLNLSNFNTSNVTYMWGMFYGCSSLTTLDLSNFNTSNAIDMGNMFYGCESLKTLDISSFNTSNVTNFSGELCLYDEYFNELPDIGGMFYNCSTLDSLDLSNFDTKNIEYAQGMLHNCTPSYLKLPKDFITNAKDGYKDIELSYANYKSVEDGTCIAPRGETYTNATEFVAANNANNGGTYVRMKDCEESSQSLKLKWGTMCYPCDVTLNDGVSAFRATGVNSNGAIVLESVEGTVPAYTPVILYSNGCATQTLPAAKYSSIAGSIYDDGNLLVGTNGSFELNKENQYVMQSKSGMVAFYAVDPANPLTTTPFRCYLEYDGTENNANKRLSLDFWDTEANGIDGTTNDESIQAPVIYNLQGQKVTTMHKGQTYIVNGQKIMIKQ